MNLTRATALLLIALPVVFNLSFFLLQRTFEYPDILRKSVSYILERFVAGGRRLVMTWYVFMASSLLFVVIAILLPQVLLAGQPVLLTAATVVGILAALVQVLGLIRWPFLVPTLARAYLDPAATPATRESVAVIFDTFNTYLGMAVGEHLGYLFTAAWTVLIALGLIGGGLPLLGWLGLVPALGIFLGVFEPAGWKPAGAINAISYVLWSLWLVVMGVVLFLG